MSNDLAAVAKAVRARTLAALDLVAASMARYQPYSARRQYSPEELEPYDALADRYMRAVEISIKCFRSYERLHYGESSDTYRDLLNRMHKLGLISGVALWLEMRDLRNRIVHDYLPERLEQLYDLMTRVHIPELLALKQRLTALEPVGAD